MNSHWTRRIYVDQETKTALEGYRMHHGYNFTGTIWYLILHEKKYEKQVWEDKILEELKKKNQAQLDSFGREILPDPKTVQKVSEEEGKT